MKLLQPLGLRWFALTFLLLTAALAPASSSDEQASLQWLRVHAIPIQTVEAGHGFADMQPLNKVVGNARIVELGEATHGTREFFQLKHRMVEFLASQKGFTIFSIEANMPEAYRLNDYVLNGVGDPKQLLKGMYFWTWDTEEVLDMILWMREFNKSGKGRIEFTGFDMQTPTVSIETVRMFMMSMDRPHYDATLDSLYNEVPLSSRQAQNIFGVAKAIGPGASLVNKCTGVVDYLEANRSRYLEAGATSKNLDWVIQNARLVLQYTQLKAGVKTRDQSMADNVKWIADHNPDAKIVLWAHNGHISNTGYPGTSSMGSYLRKMFGSQLVNFGFAFNEGSFRAYDQVKEVRPFTVDPAPEGTIDSTLAAVGIPVFAVDLRQLPRQGPVADWFAQTHRSRSIGSTYSDSLAPNLWTTDPANAQFDVLLFVEKTTASHPNP